MNTTKIRDELISVFHTFLAIFIPILLTTLNSLDFNNLTKEVLLAAGIAAIRSAVKLTWNKLMPQYMLSSDAKGY